MDEIREIPLVDIDWPDPIREEINQRDIEKMKKSIQATGQIQPIIVQYVSPHKYHGIVGRLRYLGAEQAQVSTILSRIHAFTDESEKKVWQLVENLVRRELNPIVKAEALEKLRAHYESELGMAPEKSAEPIVESIRKEVEEVSGEEAPSKRTVYRSLEIAKSFPDSVKKLLRSAPRDTFGKRHAEQLLRLKEDPEGMLKAAKFILHQKPTSAGLKTFVDDYFKVENQAVEAVKEAEERGDITMRHAAAISAASIEIQEPILNITKKGALKASETKKIADFAEGHEDRVEELLEKGAKEPEQAVAIASGRDVLETEEEVKTFFRGKKGLAKEEKFEIPCECPQCQTRFKRPIKVQWEKGEITFP